MSLNSPDWASIQYQNANNSVRVTDQFMEAVHRGQGVEPHRAHRRLGRRDDRRARRPPPDRRGRVGVRRPGRPVRHDDQLLAHAPEHGPHQRVEPVLGVHVHRRLGVQPRVAEPHEVPPRGRRVRRRGVRARGRRRLPRAGDRGRLLVLSHARDRPQREGVPPARARLREPRRAPHGARAPVRLGRGSRVRGRDHRAHDRSRLPQVGRGRAADGPVRRLPAERGRDDRRHREAPRGGRQHRQLALRARRPALCGAARLGRRALARRGLRLPQRAGHRARADRDDQLHDGLRHDRGRARLLAREVEAARRRRRDHDRQQDRADGAREARLRADRGRRGRRVHRRAQHDRRRAVRQDRALPGLRLRDRRPRDPLHGPREDDGRRPAVHLGRDLEDGEPARGDHGRRDLAAPHRVVAARRQGDRDLPRQLQGRAAALGEGRTPARRRSLRSPASSVRSRSAAACPTTASRSAASSRSASTRATSTSASSTTGRPATSSWTSRRRARPSPA